MTLPSPPEPRGLRPPHAPLTRYYAHEEDRRDFVVGLFNRTASDYQRIEALLSFGTGGWYRRQALLRAGLKRDMRVVDVGVGTGLVARAAAAIVGRPDYVTGVDPSSSMLEHAQVPNGVRLLTGSAESIPLADASA